MAPYFQVRLKRTPHLGTKGNSGIVPLSESLGIIRFCPRMAEIAIQATDMWQPKYTTQKAMRRDKYFPTDFLARTGRRNVALSP
jgi:hypothetical protein